MHQLELISKLRHSHLVSALGHCYEFLPDGLTISRVFLIFEYFPYWTLRSHVSGKMIFLGINLNPAMVYFFVHHSTKGAKDLVDGELFCLWI